jgi:class 3 adenylate cyclase
VPVLGCCFLGRAATCQIVLPDTKVSRQHALIQGQDENEFWLIDLGSANGTYLNGRRVAQPCRLSEGDKIDVAGFAFIFHGPKGAAVLSSDSSTTDATVHEIRPLMCWLLVADIEGSTQLLRKVSSEDAPRITGRWLATCRKLLGAHHGTINKYLGDGFLAYWPAGPESPGWVAQSLLALKKVQETAEPLFRVVVHYGKVSVGGPASMGEESLAGNEVNFVFRMEKLAASLGESRLLSEPALAELKPLLPTIEAGHHAVHGFEGQFPFFSY